MFKCSTGSGILLLDQARKPYSSPQTPCLKNAATGPDKNPPDARKWRPIDSGVQLTSKEKIAYQSAKEFFDSIAQAHGKQPAFFP
jgi:hypothetical protein